MTIDILCKVVDNYGDIGVVFRLARALSELDRGLRLRLIVDDLAAFKALEPKIDPALSVQTVRGWTVVGPAGASELFRAERPRFVVECFACGRPDWYEDILFDPADTERRLIVNLEYLSAEDFAVEMHKMPSATRSALVRKAIFMPGFAAGTGGLVIDRGFRELRSAYADRSRRPGLRAALLKRLASADALKAEGSAPATDLRNGGIAGSGDRPQVGLADAFWVSVFSYERDYGAIVRDLAAFHEKRPVLALSAAGRNAEPFRSAWEREGKPFPLIALPFLPQETWDEVILAADLALVRGEESLSRAALAGKPFLWHAYPLADAHQMVKVRALVGLMRPFFASTDFQELSRAFMAYNEDPAVGLAGFLGRFETENEKKSRIEANFEAFSESIIDLGNLAEGLLTFMRDFG